MLHRILSNALPNYLVTFSIQKLTLTANKIKLQRARRCMVSYASSIGLKHMVHGEDMWRACCYFIILSVVFPDGDRSLLVSPSDLLAR